MVTQYIKNSVAECLKSARPNSPASWIAIATLLYAEGIRAEHLQVKGGDREIIAFLENAIVRTFPENGRHLLSQAKLSDLTVADKALRHRYIVAIGHRRGYLRKHLQSFQEKTNVEFSSVKPSFRAIQAKKINLIIDNINHASQKKLDFDSALVVSLLGRAVKELI